MHFFCLLFKVPCLVICQFNSMIMFKILAYLTGKINWSCSKDIFNNNNNSLWTNPHLRWTLIMSYIIFQGQPSTEHFTDIWLGEFFLYLYLNLPPNDIWYIAFWNSFAFLNVCPDPNIASRNQFDSKGVYSLSAQCDAKPLDNIIALGIASHDALEKGNVGGGLL